MNVKMKLEKLKLKNIPVHEHLEFSLKNTTYADRLQWLEEANEFVRTLQKNKNYPHWNKKS